MYLCGYPDQNKPGPFDKPDSIIFVSDIEQLEDNYEGKKGHFLIKIVSGESIHFKSDSIPEKEIWVQAVNAFREHYKGMKSSEEDTRESHKEEIDLKVLTRIMEEQETLLSTGQPSPNDYRIDLALKAKKLYSTIHNMSTEVQKHHVQLGFVKKTSGRVE